MAILGKGRNKAGKGLGRSVGSGGVMELDREPDVYDQEVEVIVTPQAHNGAVGLGADVAPHVLQDPPRQLSRAERKAIAKAEKDAAKASGEPPVKKSSKARKAEKEAEEAARDNHRLSNMVMIDFYPGMAKEDAIETARHWAMTHMNIPSMCFYHVMKIRDGYAIEVQEGVGKAYLPSVLELAQASPGRLIVVPMIRRKMTVFYSARLGEFESQILPELQEPPSMPENPPIQAVRSATMVPVMKQYREWFVAGASTALVGGLSLLLSMAFYAFDPGAKVPPEWRTTDVAQLPIMQWGRLQANATDSYVTRLEFQDGQWRVVRRAVESSVDVATPETTQSGTGIVGGVVPTAPVAGGPTAPISANPGAPAPSRPVNIPPPNMTPGN